MIHCTRCGGLVHGSKCPHCGAPAPAGSGPGGAAACNRRFMMVAAVAVAVAGMIAAGALVFLAGVRNP